WVRQSGDARYHASGMARTTIAAAATTSAPRLGGRMSVRGISMGSLHWKVLPNLVSVAGRVVTGLAALCFPGAEDGQDLVASPGRDRLVRDMADGADCLTHLLHVGSAAVALGKVSFDRGALIGRQYVFQVGRHQLHELFAHDFVVGGGHGCSVGDKYGSTAART